MRERTTIIIPCHNHARFLRQAVESVLREDVGDREIWIVDDGSTDDPAAAVADLPVRLLRHDRRLGPGAARNTGLRRATGDVVYFLDADDRLVPGGLTRAVGRLRKEGLDVLAGRVAGFIDGEGRVLEGVWGRVFLDLPEGPLTRDFFLKGGLFNPVLSRFVYRRSRVERAGFFDESTRFSDDIDYLLRHLSLGPVPLADIPLYYYRHHGDNLVLRREGDEMLVDRAATIESRLVLLSHGVPAWPRLGERPA